MKLLIVYAFGAILVVSGHNTCRRNSGLMKSIQYQLKLVEENNGNCVCDRSHDKSTHRSHDKKEARIGFLALNSKVLQNIPKNKDVIFDLVKTNQGNAYDPTTGTFTAPAEGLYSFSWTVLTQSNKYFATYLALNGQSMARNHAFANGFSTQLSVSQSVVLYMKKGDKVVIKTYMVGQYMYAEGWSTFSGFLIN